MIFRFNLRKNKISQGDSMLIIFSYSEIIWAVVKTLEVVLTEVSVDRDFCFA